MTTINHPTHQETFQDFIGNNITFQITQLDLGVKYCAAAAEITDSNLHRTFDAYDNLDPSMALVKLRQLIKTELNKRYFSENDGNKFADMNFEYFRGHIVEGHGEECSICVDGKEMTLNDFGEFLKPMVGFRIEVKIIEE